MAEGDQQAAASSLLVGEFLRQSFGRLAAVQLQSLQAKQRWQQVLDQPLDQTAGAGGEATQGRPGDLGGSAGHLLTADLPILIGVVLAFSSPRTEPFV